MNIKRLWCVVLVPLFLLTACSQIKTEEERKAELKAQIKIEKALEIALKQAIIDKVEAKNKERLQADLAPANLDNQPTHYYQEILYNLCLKEYGAESKEAMDNLAYQSSAEFKEAVDTIYERGYQLIAENGYYRIVNPHVVDINYRMRVKEMCDLLGIGLEDLEQVKGGGYFTYWTTYENEEVSFSIGHEMPLKGDEYLSAISIKGYEFSLLGISLGQNVLKAYDIIEKDYDAYESHHSDTVAKYLYNVDDYAFGFNNYGWDNQHIISETEIINQIHYYELLD